jgi:hypothetical protein
MRKFTSISVLAGVAAMAVTGCGVNSGSAASRGSCDPNYEGACLNPNAADYDCAGGSGNGPEYVEGPVQVVGTDVYGLDGNGDGEGCE